MRALFDLSFSRFVVPRLVRWLYLGCLALAALALVGALASAIPAAMSEQIVLDALEISNEPRHAETSLSQLLSAHRSSRWVWCWLAASPPR
jgi:hypothetical protein